MALIEIQAHCAHHSLPTGSANGGTTNGSAKLPINGVTASVHPGVQPSPAGNGIGGRKQLPNRMTGGAVQGSAAEKPVPQVSVKPQDEDGPGRQGGGAMMRITGGSPGHPVSGIGPH